MLSVIFVLAILVSIFLILLVLIQPGKGDMMSGMGGLNLQFNSAFGSSKATSLLTKITWISAAIILVLSLSANMFFADNATIENQLAPTESLSPQINTQAPAGIESSQPPVENPNPPASTESQPETEASGSEEKSE